MNPPNNGPFNVFSQMGGSGMPNPLDPEVQRRIEEIIRQQNVDQNLQAAYEHHPESFAPVQMLYVKCTVNGISTLAFIDTGAQNSIISPKFASMCGLERLIDVRFIGEAKGVGTGKIVGKIHSAPIQLGGSFLPCSLHVLESLPMPFLFGLDMLRRHQITIDLCTNTLVVHNEHISFLSEGERRMLEASYEGAAASTQPGGTTSTQPGGAVPANQTLREIRAVIGPNPLLTDEVLNRLLQIYNGSADAVIDHILGG